MFILIAFSVVGCSLVFPNWMLLIICVPFSMVLSNMSLLPPLLSVGGAEIQFYDVIMPLIFLKLIAALALQRRRVHLEYLYIPVVCFLVALATGTMISYYRFGAEIFTSEITALLRFLSQVSAFFLFIYSCQTYRQLEYSHKLFRIIGYVIAISIYLNLALLPTGVKVGEVQTGPEIVRIFGPLGDQAAFVLPLFIYRELLARNVLGASFLGGALLATGTRGAFVALAVGMITLLFYMPSKHLREGRYLFAMIAFGGIITLGFLMNPNSMLDRFLNPEFFDFGLTHRISVVTLAMEVFLHNVLFGVGFTGFRFTALDYGAEAIFAQRLYYAPSLIATTANQYLQVATDGGILALATFLWMVKTFLKMLKTASGYPTGGLRDLLGAGYIWLLSLLIGNQSAAWLLPSSMVSYLLWVILGMAIATLNIMQCASRCYPLKWSGRADIQTEIHETLAG